MTILAFTMMTLQGFLIIVCVCIVHSRPIHHEGLFQGLFVEGKCHVPHCRCVESRGMVQQMICDSRKLTEWPIEYDEKFSVLRILNLGYNRGLVAMPSISSIPEQLPALQKLVLTGSGLSGNCHFTDMFRNYGITVENANCPGKFFSHSEYFEDIY